VRAGAGGGVGCVRVEVMGSQKCRIVGKSQSVFIMIYPIIFTRTRTVQLACCPGTASLPWVQGLAHTPLAAAAGCHTQRADVAGET
jgi:hypothetical protein